MPHQSERPLGVALIAIVDMLAAVVLLAVAAMMAKGIGLAHLPPWALKGLAARAPFMALLALVPGALGLGLWNLQNWARMATVAFSVLEFLVLGYRLAVSEVVIAVLFRSATGYPALFLYMAILRLALIGVIAVYLLRPRVAEAFAEAW
jgi:hypothetical protein